MRWLEEHIAALTEGPGRGRSPASLPVVLNLLAFALHTGCDLIETAWQQARQRLRARIRMFTRLATITAYHVFPSWSALMRTLIVALRRIPDAFFQHRAMLIKEP